MAKETTPKKDRPLDILEKYNLTLEQEMFCQYFTSPTEFYGNGVQSYASAYNLDLTDSRSYNTAKSRASQLLTSVNVINRINDLLDVSGFNDQNIDKQLLMIISQSADFHAKLGAIREYNKLKTRIVEKLDLMSGGMPITTINILPAAKREEAVQEEEAVDVPVAEVPVEEAVVENPENNANGGDTTGTAPNA